MTDWCCELVRDRSGSVLASVKRIGGLIHWRIGRLGGSVYLRKPAARVAASVVDATWNVAAHGNPWRRHLGERIVFGRKAAIAAAPPKVSRELAAMPRVRDPMPRHAA